MSNAYSQHAMDRGDLLRVDMATSLETIETQRRWKLAGVLGGFIMVIVVLFATEALMLSQIPPGERSLNPQPGEFAPYYP